MRWYSALLHLYPRSFRVEYGDELIAVFRSRVRDARGGRARVALWLDVLLDTVTSAAAAHLDLARQDLRSAVRAIRRSPGFSLTVVLVAALGIGSTAAAFAVTDHVLLRPLPFSRPDRLVKLYQDQSFRGYSRLELSPPNFLDWQRESRSFIGMAAYSPWSSNLLGAGDPVRLDGATVTSSVFSVLGVAPSLGRPLTTIDDQPASARTLVISHSLWMTQFGGRHDVLGQSVLLDDEAHTIVGVMPASFNFPSRQTSFWAPLRLTGPLLEDRTNWYLNVVARLKDEVPLEQARAEMKGIAAQLAMAYPDANARTSATVIDLRDEVTRQARLTLWALAGASLCMLLIACTNLASLLLSRTLDRHRELSVRAALGAGRERLVRQMLTENLLLTVAGGAIGALAATAVVPLVTRLVPISLPIADVPALDARLLGICLLVTLGTGLLFGVLPSLKLASSASLDGLKDGVRTGVSHATERLRSMLVIGEITASMVLIICAGLLLQALWRVQAVNPGFEASGVLTLRTSLPMPKYAATSVRQRFYGQVLDEIRSFPGVRHAGYISFLPMVMRGGIWPITVDGQPLDSQNPHTVSLRQVTPGFFDALRIPVLRGRDIREADRIDSPRVVVVSDSFVKRHWPALDPLGRRVSFAFGELEVVGVVQDIKVRGLERESEPQIYLASAQFPDESLVYYSPKDLVVSAAGDLPALVPLLRNAVARADPLVPISDIRPLSEIVEADMAARVVQVRVLGAFAATAFLLAAVGLHGLLAFSVAARTREIGVRFALGATPAGVMRLVVGRGLLLAACGIGVGLVVAAWAASALQTLLFGVDPRHAGVYGAAVGLCLAIAILGTVLPALRAMRVDPLDAIRAE
jgi:putative ABC transport system permease protein